MRDRRREDAAFRRQLAAADPRRGRLVRAAFLLRARHLARWPTSGRGWTGRAPWPSRSVLAARAQDDLPPAALPVLPRRAPALTGSLAAAQVVAGRDRALLVPAVGLVGARPSARARACRRRHRRLLPRARLVLRPLLVGDLFLVLLWWALRAAAGRRRGAGAAPGAGRRAARGASPSSPARPSSTSSPSPRLAGSRAGAARRGAGARRLFLAARRCCVVAPWTSRNWLVFRRLRPRLHRRRAEPLPGQRAPPARRGLRW